MTEATFTLPQMGRELRRTAASVFVVKPHEINLFTFAVLGRFKQVNNTIKSRLSGKFGRDIVERHFVNCVDNDMSFFEPVTATNLDPWLLPYPNT